MLFQGDQRGRGGGALARTTGWPAGGRCRTRPDARPNRVRVGLQVLGSDHADWLRAVMGISRQ